MRKKFFYIQEQSKVLRDAFISYRWLHLAGMYGNNIQFYATLVPVRIAYSWGGSFPSLSPWWRILECILINPLETNKENYSTSPRKCEE